MHRFADMGFTNIMPSVRFLVVLDNAVATSLVVCLLTTRLKPTEDLVTKLQQGRLSVVARRFCFRGAPRWHDVMVKQHNPKVLMPDPGPTDAFVRAATAAHDAVWVACPGCSAVRRQSSGPQRFGRWRDIWCGTCSRPWRSHLWLCSCGRRWFSCPLHRRLGSSSPPARRTNRAKYTPACTALAPAARSSSSASGSAGAAALPPSTSAPRRCKRKRCW